MKKHTKLVHISLLAILYLFLLFVITEGKFIYASDVDFIRQHAVFPDYFRNLFYNTGQFFPQFAPHLAGGQNIFYFAYYGFLNPIILLSYILPFVSMTTYIMYSHILLVFVSVVLIYFFLHKNKMPLSVCFIGSILFLLSNAFLFHSHRHIMFMNYMPFLLLAFFGVIRYFEKKKSLLLIVSVFLLILTSFYFSIPCILAICFYGLFYYLQTVNTVDIKALIKTAFSFFLPIFLGIFLAAFFLLPIAFVILHGREATTFSFSLNMFLPKVKLEYLLYGTYGVGGIAILWCAFIYHLLFSKKENRTLAICLGITTLFPIFNLILNGGLYENGKCFLPFLPLYTLLIGKFLKNVKKTEPAWMCWILGILVSFLFLDSSYLFYFALDVCITILSIYFVSKKKNYIYCIPILVIALVLCIVTNKTDTLVSTSAYQEIEKYRNLPIEEAMADSFYRIIEQGNGSNDINYSKAKNDYRVTSYSSTTNPFYTQAFYQTFFNNNLHRNKFMLNETNNPFFQKFMGIKYILTTSHVPYGYSLKETYENASLYETENIFPIGFASSHLLSQEEYESLPFPQNLEAFLNNIIQNGDSSEENIDFLSEKVDLSYTIQKQENLIVTQENDHYKISSEDNGELNVVLREPIENASLLIQFKMNEIPSCTNGDVVIRINEITNKLTCKSWKYYNENETFTYMISSKQPIKNLKIEFTKGSYDLSNIEIYQIPNHFFDISPDIDSIYNIVKNENNTILRGKVDARADEYFLFTIPYDKGFTILVDGKKVEYELVNEAFIGFKIAKGTHEIELKFEAPFVKVGTILSLVTIIFTATFLLLEKKKNCNR